MELMTKQNKRLKPPPGVLDGTLFECLSEKQKFILAICLLKALHAEPPGTFLLPFDHFDQYSRYDFDRDKVRSCLYMFQTHNIIAISTFDAAYYITIKNWNNYKIH